MRIKNLIKYIAFLLIFSCADPGGDPVFEGFEFSVANRTNLVYQGEIVIGGFVNNKFIATDSIQFIRDLKIGGGAVTLGYHFIDDNRWKPNLDKIRNIPSEKCYFKLKLSNGRTGIITKYNSNELFSLFLPKNKQFKGRYGNLFLHIDNDQISGNASEEL